MTRQSAPGAGRESVMTSEQRTLSMLWSLDVTDWVQSYGNAIVEELGLLSATCDEYDRIYVLLGSEINTSLNGQHSQSQALDALVKHVIAVPWLSPSPAKVTRLFVGKQSPHCVISGTPQSWLDQYAEMLWSEQVGQVVALADAPWWPDAGATQFMGPIQVHLANVHDVSHGGVSASVSQGCLRRHNIERPFTVMRIRWPDFGIVAAPALNELIGMITRQQLNTPGKLAVHCTAGRGRSGTFVTSLALIQSVQQVRVMDPLSRFAAGLCSFVAVRVQRPGAVETAGQFASIFAAGEAAQALIESQTL